MAEIRVALVLSGGVSLGTYIAGALDELLYAFEASHQGTGDRYVIDVITGASAGATTGAIIAHGLLYRGGSTNLYDAWVKEIDFQDLLQPQTSGPVSLLNANPVQTLARKVLAWPDPQQPIRRAQCCAPELYLAMTIANIDPIQYQAGLPMQTVAGPSPFVQTRHAEQETFVFTAAVAPSDDRWQRVGQVAVASAALPLAFPLVRLRRKLDDPLQYIRDTAGGGPVYTPGDTEREFMYADGGTFNNLPIDLAWHYARKIDQTPDGMIAPNRLIVMVDPWPDAAPSSPGSRTQSPGILGYIGKLLSAVRSESSSIQFENQIIKPAAAQAAQPSRLPPVEAPIEPDPTLEPKTLPGQTPPEYNDDLAIAKTIPGLPPDSSSKELISVGDDDSTAKGIPGVDMAPISILSRVRLITTNSPYRLRGSYLFMALSGFLDQKFRIYDYRRGAKDALELAREVLGVSYTGRQSANFYQPDADSSLGPNPTDYQILSQIPSSQVPNQTVQQVFETSLRQRLHSLIPLLVDDIQPPGPAFLWKWALQLLLWLNFSGLRTRIAEAWKG